jgi:hypothetical protein
MPVDDADLDASDEKQFSVITNVNRKNINIYPKEKVSPIWLYI